MNPDTEELTISFFDGSGAIIEEIVEVKLHRLVLDMKPDYASSDALLETTKALDLAREKREERKKRDGSSSEAGRALYTFGSELED